jgi:hypothetical protein
VDDDDEKCFCLFVLEYARLCLVACERFFGEEKRLELVQISIYGKVSKNSQQKSHQK